MRITLLHDCEFTSAAFRCPSLYDAAHARCSSCERWLMWPVVRPVLGLLVAGLLVAFLGCAPSPEPSTASDCTVTFGSAPDTPDLGIAGRDSAGKWTVREPDAADLVSYSFAGAADVGLYTSTQPASIGITSGGGYTDVAILSSGAVQTTLPIERAVARVLPYMLEAPLAAEQIPGVPELRYQGERWVSWGMRWQRERDGSFTAGPVRIGADGALSGVPGDTTSQAFWSDVAREWAAVPLWARTRAVYR